MSKNYLLEAAAEILNASKAAAPKEEMKKLPGTEVEELGGPTPENEKVDKFDPASKISKMTPPGKSPNVGTAPMEKLAEEEEKIDEVVETPEVDAEALQEWKTQLKSDIDAILSSESNLSEEFRQKIATIYEARVTDKVNQIQETLEQQYAELFEQSTLELSEKLSSQVEDHLNYVVEEWVKENEVAIETGLRSELTEEFIAGMKNLFAEHYIDIPAEKVDLVEGLAAKVEALEDQLNEEIERSISFKKQIEESKKDTIVRQVCEGLAQTQVEKILTLAEGVEFSAEADFTSKIQTIRENFFPTGTVIADAAKVLNETMEAAPVEEKKDVQTDPVVSAYAAHMTRIK